MSKMLIDELRTSRWYYSLGVVVPGLSASTREVGGAGGNDFRTTLVSHGGRGEDQRVMQNGLTLGAIDTAAASAERQAGGVSVNFIPRDGGNTLRGSMFVTSAAEIQQASNFTQERADLGATTSPQRQNRQNTPDVTLTWLCTPLPVKVRKSVSAGALRLDWIPVAGLLLNWTAGLVADATEPAGESVNTRGLVSTSVSVVLRLR
jgi:hypothetical protein